MENQANNTMGASPCEAELQELMEQIDIMVSNKKLDWERKMRALETRLDLRDQELANAQTCLDQKGQEVGLLRQKLDSLEKCNLAMTQNYEGQLQTLKAQFSKLTNSFEKLRLHQMKQSKVRRKELLHPREEIPFELSNLNQKLEEFRAKSREWDKQEILYQTHLVSLDAQQKLLSEKCNQFQKQAQSYQTQLNGKKQCIEDGSSEVPQLMCEPDHSCEASERDEFIIEKLKSAVSEIALSRNKLQDENQKLLQELKMYQRQCQAMEAGLSEVKSELQSRDDLLRIIEMERLQLHRELLKIGECQNTHENKKRHESSYSPSTKEPERKRKELFPVILDQPNHEKELNKIRSQLYQEEECHGSEQERMRNEISDLTEELHQKEITIATIMKKAAFLERQLKMELEIKEKMLSKQQVSDMRYKAVRTENTHLKGMMGDLDPGQYMTSEITDIKSLDFTNREHSRHTSINKLEHENERLRNDLAKLRSNGKSAWANQNTYEEMGRYTYQNQMKMEKNEDRLSQDREPNRSVTPPLPPLPFQTREMTSPLVSDDEVFPLSPPDIVFPASLAAQHFLLEEEKRAKEFEKLLNSHIDELQKHTEFTLNKYTKLKQNRHI
ncbi:deuterosome assembly protein 1 isoform X1 [Prionailurus viverrinus]|uniref:deuterosome assembly protein 1 isoform X1 n=1 Tax=Prionailurus bengalensis TaxID=37029 RepID=UPI001CA8F197|nr:deuterosome assembly protein 1 isoform X1 [Prionailurus bengalensis]XP_043435887.1 deuterosome assembly protein 1 isoform X1 [Prionailurus bengalensis]XP_047679809.1 deuterosome assembly protein 1 isoform X1 [Prionailurus viverrinus]XP_047679810.1 deuterosome assembly protein 1 isoform X1 [Prionailurus viverrinus]